MRKKVSAILTAFVCALSLTACSLFGGGGGGTEPPEPSEYMVTYDTDGADYDIPSEWVRAGDSVSLYTLTKQGDYTFDGWYDTNKADGTKYTDTYTPTGDVTLYAKFLDHTFPLEPVDEESPTCDYEGVQAHWRCSYCDARFADSDGKRPVSFDDLEIPVEGEHPYAQEYTANGVTHRRYATCDLQYLYTDFGVHDALGKDGACSVCGHAPVGVTEGLQFINGSTAQECWVIGIENAQELDTLVIPAEHEGRTVTRIASSAFASGYNNITAVVLPATLKSIGNGAFLGVSIDCDVAFSGTIEQWCNVNVESPNAFPTHKLIIGGEEVVDVEIPDSVTSLRYQFTRLEKLGTITFGKNLQVIQGFATCSVEEVRYTGTLADWLSIRFSSGANPIGKGTDLYIDGALLTEVVVPQSITEIQDEAFANYDKLTKVTLHDGVTEIGDSAFSHCSSLVRVDGMRGVRNIGVASFSTCELLKSVLGTEALQTIDDQAFYGCASLTDLTLPDNVTQIGRIAFGGCNQLVSEESDIYYLGKWAVGTTGSSEFASPKLVFRADTVGLADSLCIGNGKIVEVTIPGSVRYMGNSVFDRCSSLQKLTVEKGVTAIPEDAFRSCEELKEVSLPDGLLSIGSCAFGFTGTETIVIPDTVTQMGDYVFAGCKSLRSVKVSKRLRVLPQYAFKNCTALTEVDLGEVEKIDMEAFANCTSLKTFTLPTTCINIEAYAFEGCEALTKVSYIGTEDMWARVTVRNDNECLTRVVVCEPPVD